MTDDPLLLAFLGTAAFLASFMDSAVGGGGLISVPALMATGWPLPLVFGTNKLAALFSSSTSAWNFYKKGKIHGRMAFLLFPLSVVCAGLGAWTLEVTTSSFLKPLAAVLLALVLAFTLLRKDWGQRGRYSGLGKGKRILTAVGAVVLGFYDGFFGPGTGSFLIFTFLLLGFEFPTAAGNAKVLNLGSNLGALGVFAVLGRVRWDVGLFMGVFMVLGATVGSRLALRGGSRYLRPLFIAVTLGLLGKVIWDLWKGP